MKDSSQTWIITEDLKAVLPARADAAKDGSISAVVTRDGVQSHRLYKKGEWFESEEKAKFQQLLLVIEKMTEATDTLMHMGVVKNRLVRELRHMLPDELKDWR